MLSQDFVSYLSNPDFYADPYPYYARMREETPIFFTELRGGCWVFSSYSDVAHGLRNELLSSARLDPFVGTLAKSPAEREEFRPLVDCLSKWLLYTDPPRHSHVRKLLGRAFAQTSIERLRPRIEQMSKVLLERARTNGQLDVISDFSFQLPLMVIVELLGVSAERHDDFIRWSGDIGQLTGGGLPTAELTRRTQRSVLEMMDCLREQVALRRRAPADDLLSVLIHAEEDGMQLTEAELYAQCTLLLFAGHETTRNLIGNGLYALLRHPQELVRLRRDPDLLRNAVEELLRFDSPVQMLTRVITRDFNYKGHALRKGQFVMLFMGSANRDPAQFSQPDMLDVGRKEIKHLSFITGPHMCLGAGLARMEAQIALGQLLQFAPSLSLVGDAPRYVNNLVLRGLASLPVSF